jgi:hypothetical protein
VCVCVCVCVLIGVGWCWVEDWGCCAQVAGWRVVGALCILLCETGTDLGVVEVEAAPDQVHEHRLVRQQRQVRLARIHTHVLACVCVCDCVVSCGVALWGQSVDWSGWRFDAHRSGGTECMHTLHTPHTNARTKGE